MIFHVVKIDGSDFAREVCPRVAVAALGRVPLCSSCLPGVGVVGVCGAQAPAQNPDGAGALFALPPCPGVVIGMTP